MRWWLAALVLLFVSNVQAHDNAAAAQFGIRSAVEGTEDTWRHADAVVRLRIEGTKPLLGNRVADLGGLSVEHTATVITALKTHAIGGPVAQSMTFAQFGSTGEKPCAKGEEYIAFLHWTVDNRFITGAFYPVKKGEVDWLVSTRDTPWRIETMKVEDFIARLLALPK